MTQMKGPVERVLARDQWVVAGAVGIIVVLAGLYTVWGVGMNMSALDMTRMAGATGQSMEMGMGSGMASETGPGMAMAMGADWSWAYAGLIFLMWWIMMVAMMTPSAAPTLLLYTALKRQGSERERAVSLSLMFLSGYLLAWAGFSVVATTLQWATEAAGLTSTSMMTLSSRTAAGAVLIVAGLFQFSSLKSACLKHCRSPAHFLAQHRARVAWGAMRIGMHHGTYCLGCCWALMALLFVGGIMNLYWIVGLALYVLAEKLVPYPRAFSQVTGAALLAAGLWVLGTRLAA
ncbi:MAG: DUF2182 domain-containing protein [Paracoccaceae bacterium]